MELTKKQKAFLDYYTAHPFDSIKSCAEAVGVAPNTVYISWRYLNPEFKAVMDAILEQAWDAAKYTASKTMMDLCEAGDFKSAKYILDHHGFGGTQKIEASLDNTITISIDDVE